MVSGIRRGRSLFISNNGFSWRKVEMAYKKCALFVSLRCWRKCRWQPGRWRTERTRCSMLLFLQNFSFGLCALRVASIGMFLTGWLAFYQSAYGDTQASLSQCTLHDDFVELELAKQDTLNDSAEVRVRRGNAVSNPLSVTLAAGPDGSFSFGEFPIGCLTDYQALVDFANDPNNPQPLTFSDKEIPLWALQALAKIHGADVAVFQTSGPPHVCGGGYVVLTAKDPVEDTTGDGIPYGHELVQALIAEDPNTRLEMHLLHSEDAVPFPSKSHEKFLEELNTDRAPENRQDELWIASLTGRFKVHVSFDDSSESNNPGVWGYACKDWNDAVDTDEIGDLVSLKQQLASLTLAQLNDPKWRGDELKMLQRKLQIFVAGFQPEQFLLELQGVMDAAVWLAFLPYIHEALATSEDPDGRAMKVLDSFEVSQGGSWLYRDGLGTETADFLRDGFRIDGIGPSTTDGEHESSRAMVFKPRREGGAMGSYQVAIAQHQFDADIDLADLAYVSYSIKSVTDNSEFTAQILLLMFDPVTGKEFYAEQRDATKKTYAEVYDNWQVVKVPLDTNGYRGLRAHVGLKIRGYQIVLGRTSSDYLWDDDDTVPELHLDYVQLLGCIEGDIGKIANCSPKHEPKSHPDNVSVRFDFEVALSEMQRLTEAGFGDNHADLDIQGPGRDSEFSLRIETKGAFDKKENTGRKFAFTPEDWSSYASLSFAAHTPEPDASDGFQTIGVAIRFLRNGEEVTLWQEAIHRIVVNETHSWKRISVPLTAKSFPATDGTTTKAAAALNPEVDLKQVVGVWFFVDRNGENAAQRTLLVDDVYLHCKDEDGKCKNPVQSGGGVAADDFECPRDINTEPFGKIFPEQDGTRTHVVCDYVTNTRNVSSCDLVKTVFGEVPNLFCPEIKAQVTSFVKITIPPLVFADANATVNVTFENSSPEHVNYKAVPYRVKYLRVDERFTVAPWEVKTVTVRAFNKDASLVPEQVYYEDTFWVESLGRHEKHPDEAGQGWSKPLIIDIKGGASSEQAKRRVAQWDFNDRPPLIKEQDGFSSDRHDKDPGASLTGIFAGPEDDFDQHFAPDDDFMVTFWVYPPTRDDVPEDHEGAIIGNRLESEAGWELRLTRYLQPSLVLQGPDGAQQTYSVAQAPTTIDPLRAWHQVTLIWNNKTPTILLDGDVLRNEGGNELTLVPNGEAQNFASSRRLVVGGGAASKAGAYVDEYWGSIDDVIVFRGAFHPSDAKTLYDDHKHNGGFDVLQYLAGLFLLDIFPDGFAAPARVLFFGGFDTDLGKADDDPDREVEQWTAWPGDFQTEAFGLSEARHVIKKPEGHDSYALQYEHDHFEEIDDSSVAALVRKGWGQSHLLSDFAKISFDAVAIQGSGAYVALQLRKPNGDTWTSKAFAMRGKQGDQNQIVVDISAAGDEFLGNLGSFPIAFVFAQPAAESTKIHGKVAFAIDNVTGHVAGTGPELTTPDADLNELGNTVVPALALGNTNILADDVLMNAFDRDVDGHSVTSLWTAYGGQVGSTAISIAEDSEWTAALRFEEDDIAKFAGLRYPPTSGKAGVDFQPLNLSAYSNVSFTAQAPGGTLAIVFVDGDGEHWRSDKTAGASREPINVQLDSLDEIGLRLSTAADDSNAKGNKMFDKSAIKEIRFHYTANVTVPKLVKFTVDDVKFTRKPIVGGNLRGIAELRECDARDNVAWDVVGEGARGQLVLTNTILADWSLTLPLEWIGDGPGEGKDGGVSIRLEKKPDGCLELPDREVYWFAKSCEVHEDDPTCIAQEGQERGSRERGIPPWFARAVAEIGAKEVAVWEIRGAPNDPDRCPEPGFAVISGDEIKISDLDKEDGTGLLNYEPDARLDAHIHLTNVHLTNDTSAHKRPVPLPSRADYKLLVELNRRNGQEISLIGTNTEEYYYVFGVEGTEIGGQYYHPKDWREACTDWDDLVSPDSKISFGPASFKWEDIAGDFVSTVSFEAHNLGDTSNQPTYQLESEWSLVNVPEIAIFNQRTVTIELELRKQAIRQAGTSTVTEFVRFLDSTGAVVGQVPIEFTGVPVTQVGDDGHVFFRDFETVPGCGDACKPWAVAASEKVGPSRSVRSAGSVSCEEAEADAPSCCGDGNIDEAEECDDENAKNGDGCSKVCLLEWEVRAAQEFVKNAALKTKDGKLVYVHAAEPQPEWSAIYKRFATPQNLQPYEFTKDKRGGMSFSILGSAGHCVRPSLIQENGNVWTAKKGYQISSDEQTIVFPLPGNDPSNPTGFLLRDWFQNEQPIEQQDPVAGKIADWSQITQITFVFSPTGDPGVTGVRFELDTITGITNLVSDDNFSEPATLEDCKEVKLSDAELIAVGDIPPMRIATDKRYEANVTQIRHLLAKSETYRRLFEITDDSAQVFFTAARSTDPHWLPVPRGGFGANKGAAPIHASAANPQDKLIAEIVHQLSHVSHKNEFFENVNHQEGFFENALICHDATKSQCGADLHGAIDRAGSSLFEEFQDQFNDVYKAEGGYAARGFGEGPMSERQWREFQYNLWIDGEATAIFNSLVILAEIKDYISGTDYDGSGLKLHDYLLFGSGADPDEQNVPCGEKWTPENIAACALAKQVEDAFPVYWKEKKEETSKDRVKNEANKQGRKRCDEKTEQYGKDVCVPKMELLLAIKQLAQYRRDHDGRMVKDAYKEKLLDLWGYGTEPLDNETHMYTRDGIRFGFYQHYNLTPHSQSFVDADRDVPPVSEVLKESPQDQAWRAKLVAALRNDVNGKDQDYIWYQHIWPRDHEAPNPCDNQDPDCVEDPFARPADGNFKRARVQFDDFSLTLNPRNGDFETCGNLSNIPETPVPCPQTTGDKGDEDKDVVAEPEQPIEPGESVLAVGSHGNLGIIVSNTLEGSSGTLQINAERCGNFQVANSGTNVIEKWGVSFAKNEDVSSDVTVYPIVTRLQPGQAGSVTICALDVTTDNILGTLTIKDAGNAGPSQSYEVEALAKENVLADVAPLYRDVNDWHVDADFSKDPAGDKVRTDCRPAGGTSDANVCMFQFKNRDVFDKSQQGADAPPYVEKIFVDIPVNANAGGSVWVRWAKMPEEGGEIHVELSKGDSEPHRVFTALRAQTGTKWVEISGSRLLDLSGVNRYFDTISFVAVEDANSTIPYQSLGELHQVAAFEISFTQPVQTLTWAGYDWEVVSGLRGADPHRIPDEDEDPVRNLADNAEKRSNGSLRLTMSKRRPAEGGEPVWHGAELKSKKTFGHGTYRIVVDSDFETLDSALVAGFFVHSREKNGPLREIDVEFTSHFDFQSPSDKFLYTVHALNGRTTPEDHSRSYPWNTISVDGLSTHCFDWTSTGVEFASYHGDAPCFSGGLAIEEWSYPGAVPDASAEHVYLNLWKRGKSLSSATHHQITFVDFSFEAEGVARDKGATTPPISLIDGVFEEAAEWTMSGAVDSKKLASAMNEASIQSDNARGCPSSFWDRIWVPLGIAAPGGAQASCAADQMQDSIVVIQPVTSAIHLAESSSGEAKFTVTNYGGFPVRYTVLDANDSVIGSVQTKEAELAQEWRSYDADQPGIVAYAFQVDGSDLAPGVYWKKLKFRNDAKPDIVIERFVQVEVGGDVVFDTRFSNLWQPLGIP